MHIEKLEITNFKAFEHLEITLNPHFNLLVGKNGTGKTSILEATAVALGILHVSHITFGWRRIEPYEIHRKATPIGVDTENSDANSIRMVPAESAQIKAEGAIDGQKLTWTRQIPLGGRRTSNKDARKAVEVVKSMLSSASEPNATNVLPVVAYFGAERLGKVAIMPSTIARNPSGGRNRMDAYAFCLHGSVRQNQVYEWLVWNQATKGSNQEKPQHRAVIEAIKKCLPGWKDFYIEEGSRDVIIILGEQRIPYTCLSAGQRLLLSMAADIAIRAETLNPHLGERTVLDTPGIVLIDEIENHLHPAWQRKVVASLQEAFPSIQFVCTSHSPQVFGELLPENILVCDRESGAWHHPLRSLGLDSSRVLEEEMGALERNEVEKKRLSDLSNEIEKENFPEANRLLEEVASQLGENDPEVTRAKTLMTFLRETKNEGDNQTT